MLWKIEPTEARLSQLSADVDALQSRIGTIPSGETVEGQITFLSTTKVDTAGTGLAKSGTTLSLDESGVTAGSYGPSKDVTGSNNSTMSVPYITIDAYGRVTSIANKTYTSKDTTYSLPLAANGTRGGVQIGYSASGKNYPVALSGEKMYVNVPWTDTDTNTWRGIQNNLTSTSTSDSLSAYQGKLLNDNKAPKKPTNYYALFDNVSVTTSAANRASYSGRKFSTYGSDSILLFTVICNNWIRNSVAIPTGRFTSTAKLEISFLEAGVNHYADATYINDTTIQVVTDSSSSIKMNVDVLYNM